MRRNGSRMVHLDFASEDELDVLEKRYLKEAPPLADEAIHLTLI